MPQPTVPPELAHALRNRLAPILSAVSLLKDHPDPATAERALAILERQVQQLASLVDSLTVEPSSSKPHEHR